MKRFFLLLAGLMACELVLAQKEKLIIGANFEQIPDSLVEMKIEHNELNYVDIMDYRVLKILKNELEIRKYEVHIKKVPQSERKDALLTQDSAHTVDLLLFSFSDSYARRRDGVEFSEPYFVNNSGIAVFSRNEHLKSNNFEKGKHDIAVLRNSTADNEISAIAQNNKKIKVIRCDAYEGLIDSLLSRKACMIVADLSRMCYFLDKYPDILYAGALKAPKSSTGEGFCVAIDPQKSYLKKVVDEILLTPQIKDKIKGQEKLLEDKIDQALTTQSSALERQLRSGWLIYGVPLLSLLVVGFLLLYFLRRKPQYTIGDAEFKKIRTALERATSDMIDSVHNTFDKIQVLENGIECLMGSQSTVLYIGSGGFMSSAGTDGNRWRKAIYDTLNRGIEFTRIVDLPERDLLFEQVSVLGNGGEEGKNKRGKPAELTLRWIKKKPDQYITRFYAWLAIQYLDLRRYESNLTLWDSRGAAFWGVGTIMLFKDKEAVLIFASTENEKMGTLLKNPNLVRPLWRDIYNTTEYGKKLTAEDIMEQYFEGFPNLKSLLDEIVRTLGPNDVLDEKTMEKIQKGAADLVYEMGGSADDDLAIDN